MRNSRDSVPSSPGRPAGDPCHAAREMRSGKHGRGAMDRGNGAAGGGKKARWNRKILRNQSRFALL